MDKTIVTTFLIIISMITAVLLFNAVYPAVIDSSDAMISMAGRADQRLKSQVEIIHATGELDSDGWWQDSNSDGDFDMLIWVKNVGSTRIVPIEGSDVFFGPEGDFVRIPHQSESTGYPYWTAVIENAADWSPTATAKIIIHFGAALAPGRYFVKVIIPNGVSDEYTFSL
ncbi:MAG: hypothetical protein CL608_33130 [Anaerolineaceae bacterium]|nr:hypothetical protein [Anaerolineaceae bacterium]